MIRISRVAAILQIVVAMCISLALSACNGAAADPSTGSATAQSATSTAAPTTSTATPTATDSLQELGQRGLRWRDCWQRGAVSNSRLQVIRDAERGVRELDRVTDGLRVGCDPGRLCDR